MKGTRWYYYLSLTDEKLLEKHLGQISNKQNGNKHKAADIQETLGRLDTTPLGPDLRDRLRAIIETAGSKCGDLHQHYLPGKTAVAVMAKPHADEQTRVIPRVRRAQAG